MRFIERILALINDNGITKNKLLSDLKLSRNSFVTWGKGAMPNSEAILKIADYFNVSTDYLLGREKDTASVTDAGLKQIMDSYATLNTAGKAKAVDYMKDLANNPNYNDTQVVKIVPKSTAQIAAYGGGVKTIETELSEEEILKILEDYDKSIGGEK